MKDGRRAVSLKPIGIIRSPFKEAAGTPIQPVFAGEERGTVELFPEYADGLRDLEGFKRAWLCIFIFTEMQATPGQRAPAR